MGPIVDRLKRLAEFNANLAITHAAVRSFLSLDPELLGLLRPECQALLQ